MIWAVLAALGVPLWLCAAGILVTVLKNRRLRSRDGDISVRVKPAGRKCWTRGHAVWVSDVFAWRASPAAWNEHLVPVIAVTLRAPDRQEQKQLHRLGDGVQIATLAANGGEPVTVAATAERSTALLGSFQAAHRTRVPDEPSTPSSPTSSSPPTTAPRGSPRTTSAPSPTAPEARSATTSGETTPVLHRRR